MNTLSPKVVSLGLVVVMLLWCPLGTLAADFGTIIPMNRKGTATYYISGNIPGFGDVEMMVDTGAGFMTINEDTLAVLRQSGDIEYVKKLTGMMADGSRRTIPVYRLAQVTLGQDCVLHDVEAAVFPRSTRLILGLSALEKAAPFVFSTNPPSLGLSNCRPMHASQ
jgi:predicted aspartyl protease